MPAILTHDFFGRDVAREAGERLGLGTDNERTAFLLGNQGPDPLFYLVADPLVRPSMRVGSLMHHERPAQLLAALRDALRALPKSERGAGRAYAAGFMCHYLLDRSVHPLVFATQHALCDAGVDGLDRSDGSLVHAEIERDLDEMVLFERTGRTVRDHRPYREVLAGTRATLATVDGLYRHMCLTAYGIRLDDGVFTHAVISFRVMQRLFWSPSGMARRAIAPLERRVTGSRYSLFCAMAHRVRTERTSPFANLEHRRWRNPFVGTRSTASFWDLYNDARALAPAACLALMDDTDADADHGTLDSIVGNLNFSGCPVDPDAPVGSLDVD